MKKGFVIATALCLFNVGYAQFTTVVDSLNVNSRKVIAGKEYAAGSLKRLFFGNDYRKEWSTPIIVPVLNLDTAFGGLTPVELGGGRQTKSLHLTDPQGRRFVLRSVNKTYTLALPEIARGTFIETIANDQIATNHPFAALTVPTMSEAANVYHTNPQLFLVPYSPRLGEYNKIFANMLCLLEERPDKTQIGQPSFGFPNDIDGSEKMIEKITGDNDVLMDQNWYVKTRLFDMFLGDWGRHIDNWRWAEFDSGKGSVFRPVPKDRDQTWAKFEGLMLTLLRVGAGLKELQSFGPNIKSLYWFNHPAFEIDRRFTNDLTKKAWVDSAEVLKASLTDAVIETAVKQMPPEIFAIRGKETIDYLKQRRDDLPQYASEYYDILAKVVDVPGTTKNELFEVNRLNDTETSVKVFKLNKEGERKQPLFSRTFNINETKEIRLYGLDGEDIYHVTGDVNDGITVRIIAGAGKDSLYDNSHVNGRTHKTKFYDNPGTEIASSPETKIRLSDSTYIYPFEKDFKLDSKGFTIAPGYKYYYGIYLGVGYKKVTYGWREEPFKSKLQFGVHYAFGEKTLNPYFNLEYPQLFGAWNVQFAAGYDGARKFNYFGTGNETVKISEDRSYHYLRTSNIYAAAGLNQDFATYHNIVLSFNYDAVRVLSRAGTFLVKPSTIIDNNDFDWKHFGGATLGYRYTNVNSDVLPTKGIFFTASATHTKNLSDLAKSFNRLNTVLQLYVPLFNPFSLMVNTGAATMSGDPEFYQLNQIGGNWTLRGYLRSRFYGKTSFYDQNELRWIPNIKSYLFNGKIGLAALYDVGRVWNPGENSDKWHYGYGAGLIVSPFNKMSAAVYYSISEEDKVVNVRLGKSF